MGAWNLLTAALLSALSLASLANGYDVKFSDTDDLRQVCTGMWANDKTYLNVTFDKSSTGRIAVVIYEYKDIQYIGKTTKELAKDPSIPKTYICTSDAVRANLCTNPELGEFILDLPTGVSLNSTSIWTKSVTFPSNATATKASGFWNNPAGNPTPPVNADSKYTSPWRATRSKSLALRDDHDPYVYTQPIFYPVRNKGYYCVGTVPVTVIDSSPTSGRHGSYSGAVHVHNTFNGNLPATDYPKINLYFMLTLAYITAGGAWGFLCWKHREDLLPIQNYISYLFGLLVIEMLATWTYYRYLNAHGEGTPATIFLFVVAILGAGRNSLSFFLLLVVSLGLSVVRETLPAMMRCRILAGAHFVFGVLYAVGIVEIELDTVSAAVLLLFVIPLAWTMTSFLLWTMYALHATIKELGDRKQRYKMGMFVQLNRILMGAVVIVMIFFVVSSMSFFNRRAEDYLPNSWAYRWWLLDGWLALLYLSAFCAIAYIWRPTGHNRRLAMSDELAQDEADAEDYDLESLEHRSRNRSEADFEDGADGHGEGERRKDLEEDGLVFEIGDEEDDKNESEEESEEEESEEESEEEAVASKGKRDDGEEGRGLITPKAGAARPAKDRND